MDIDDCDGLSLVHAEIQIIGENEMPSWKAINQIISNSAESCKFELVYRNFPTTPFYIANWSDWHPSRAGNCTRCIKTQRDTFAFHALQNGTRVYISAKGSVSADCDMNVCEMIFPPKYLTETSKQNQSFCVAFNASSTPGVIGPLLNLSLILIIALQSFTFDEQ